MGCKVLYLSVALLLCLMICEHVRAQCSQPSFESRNVILTAPYLSTKNFPVGSNVTFECMVGHVRDSVSPRPSRSVTCVTGNQWTSLELNCKRKSCGSPPELLNGRYEITGILFGDKITAVCNRGYILDGRVKERWCREQGWDGRDPVCEPVKCEAPPVIENGQLEDQPLNSYDYSQVVSYRCNKGFSLIGRSSLQCSDDGTFKPDPPTCSKGCTKPEIPNANRIGGRSPPYELGSFIDYKCDEGYTMKGEYHIVCSAEGWKPEPPQCIPLPTTTATTTTKVTSTNQPKDETAKSDTSAIVGSIAGVLLLCLGTFIVICIYKKRSKPYCEKVATNGEEPSHPSVNFRQ